MKFLELRENLGWYWKTADSTQKAVFSKIMFLNLTLSGQEMANLTLKKSFLNDEKSQFNLFGAQVEKQLEPYFEQHWSWINNRQHAAVVKELQVFINSIK